MKDKTINILLIIFSILIIAISVLAIYTLKEMVKDHYCYSLPRDEFYETKKCEKYWGKR